ncbi:MAG: polysaccharide pyruvyl transferase family protein [Burkholderiaceae bacterium]
MSSVLPPQAAPDAASGDAAGASNASRLAASLARYWSSPDPDATFLGDLADRMRAARRSRRPHRGPPRRALVIGYAGAGNTGADLRTIETILQLRRHLPGLGIDLFALGTLFDHPVLAAIPKFRPGRRYIPDVLDAVVRNYDLVLNTEGSTYTSTFSDLFAGQLIGALGIAAAHGQRAIAYGVDSGRMSDALTAFALENAADVTVVTRNEAARAQLGAIGIASSSGTDPGWGYRDATLDHAAAAKGPRTIAICPSNAFWWPTASDVPRARELDARGEHSPLRYNNFHFHSWDDRRAAAYDHYIDEQARIVDGFRLRGLEPVLVGMDRLDAAACADVAARAAIAPAIVLRGESSLSEVLQTLTHAECVVTTRFHAALVAIAHGLPVFGLAIDERIERLLADAGSASWWARADTPAPSIRVMAAFDRLFADGAERAALRARHLEFASRQAAAFEAMTAHLPSCG